MEMKPSTAGKGESAGGHAALSVTLEEQDLHAGFTVPGQNHGGRITGDDRARRGRRRAVFGAQADVLLSLRLRAVRTRA